MKHRLAQLLVLIVAALEITAGRLQLEYPLNSTVWENERQLVSFIEAQLTNYQKQKYAVTNGESLPRDFSIYDSKQDEFQFHLVDDIILKKLFNNSEVSSKDIQAVPELETLASLLNDVSDFYSAMAFKYNLNASLLNMMSELVSNQFGEKMLEG